MKEQSGKKQTATEQCPSSALISAWHDGENNETVTAHLKHCAGCRKLVDQYSLIDAVMQKAIPDHDPSMIARIIDRRSEVSFKPAVFSYGFRAAATIIIMLGISLFLWINLNYPQPELTSLDQAVIDPYQVLEPELMDGSFVVLLKSGDRLKPLYGPWMIGQPGNPASSHYPNGRLVALSENKPQPQPLTALLPHEIRHVWVVDNLPQSRRKIVEMLPEGTRCVLRTNQNESSLELTIWLNEDELQQLVERMAKQFNWALVSSNLPQPGQGGRLISQGRKIKYTCNLVKR